MLYCLDEIVHNVDFEITSKFSLILLNLPYFFVNLPVGSVESGIDPRYPERCHKKIRAVSMVSVSIPRFKTTWRVGSIF